LEKEKELWLQEQQTMINTINKLFLQIMQMKSMVIG
jgi:hypothetical protein